MSTVARKILVVAAAKAKPGHIECLAVDGLNYVQTELTMEEAANLILSVAQAMVLAADMAGQEVPHIELPDNVVPLKRKA
jgi:hypothetical protein